MVGIEFETSWSLNYLTDDKHIRVGLFILLYACMLYQVYQYTLILSDSEIGTTFPFYMQIGYDDFYF